MFLLNLQRLIHEGTQIALIGDPCQVEVRLDMPASIAERLHNRGVAKSMMSWLLDSVMHSKPSSTRLVSRIDFVNRYQSGMSIGLLERRAHQRYDLTAYANHFVSLDQARVFRDAQCHIHIIAPYKAMVSIISEGVQLLRELCHDASINADLAFVEVKCVVGDASQSHTFVNTVQAPPEEDDWNKWVSEPKRILTMTSRTYRINSKLIAIMSVREIFPRCISN